HVAVAIAVRVRAVHAADDARLPRSRLARDGEIEAAGPAPRAGAGLEMRIEPLAVLIPEVARPGRSGEPGNGAERGRPLAARLREPDHREQFGIAEAVRSLDARNFALGTRGDLLERIRQAPEQRELRVRSPHPERGEPVFTLVFAAGAFIEG